MEKRVFLIALLGALTSFVTGCADEPNSQAVPLCNEGTSVCASASSANVCRNGAWVKEDCLPSYICNSLTGKCEIQNDIQNQNQPSTPAPSTSSNPGCVEGSAKCVDANHVQKCQNGILVNYVCNINETCIDGVCSLSSEPAPAECISGTKECVDDQHSRRCQDGRWVTETCDDTDSCDAGECRSKASPQPAPDECTDGAKECVDGQHSRKCQDGRWVNETCDDTEFCDAGDCKPKTGPEPTPDECTDGAKECVDGQHSRKCQNGKWVTETCGSTEICDAGDCKPKTGPTQPDECTANARECVDDQHSRKCQNGKWVTETCSSTEKCDAGDCKPKTGTTPECDNGKSECLDADHERKCNNGKWVEKECSASESCTDGACKPYGFTPEEVLKTGTLDDVGKKCSLEDFTDNCEDNQIIYCTAEGRIGSDDRCKLYQEYSFIDMRCHVIDGIAGCVYYDDDGNPDTCNAVSDTISCNKDGNVAYHSGCGKAEDGKLYSMGQYEFSEICPMECKAGVGCVEIPADQRCDVATHVETCENNSIVSCLHGRLTKTNCGKQTCHSFAEHGVALCTDNTPCDTLGQSNACRYEINASGDDYNAFDDSFMCAKAEDKKLYSYKLSSSYCSYDCVTDIGCIQPIKGEGDDCSELVYEEKCRYGENFSAALACINGTVEAIYCAKGKVCMNEMDSPTFVAGCYDDNSICAKGSADYTVCSGSGNYYSTVTYECKLMSDKKYHYTPNTDKLVSCKNGCNAAGTGCK